VRPTLPESGSTVSVTLPRAGHSSIAVIPDRATTTDTSVDCHQWTRLKWTLCHIGTTDIELGRRIRQAKLDRHNARSKQHSPRDRLWRPAGTSSDRTAGRRSRRHCRHRGHNTLFTPPAAISRGDALGGTPRAHRVDSRGHFPGVVPRATGPEYPPRKRRRGRGGRRTGRRPRPVEGRVHPHAIVRGLPLRPLLRTLRRLDRGRQTRDGTLQPRDRVPNLPARASLSDGTARAGQLRSRPVLAVRPLPIRPRPARSRRGGLYARRRSAGNPVDRSAINS